MNFEGAGIPALLFVEGLDVVIGGAALVYEAAGEQSTVAGSTAAPPRHSNADV